MHAASMRRAGNAKIVGRARKDHQKGLHKAVAKGKARLPGARAGVRKPSGTPRKAPSRTTDSMKTTDSKKSGKSVGSVVRPSAGAPSWERHVHKRNVKFPLKEFDLAAMSGDELIARDRESRAEG